MQMLQAHRCQDIAGILDRFTGDKFGWLWSVRWRLRWARIVFCILLKVPAASTFL